ncbi:hypothetical protein BC834DRAFT_311102 [Gloeopeniophorella convolvens]|nr:hypothetical protein BC834DRAFT_311102 [Gloeopeniophorella convolvens]
MITPADEQQGSIEGPTEHRTDPSFPFGYLDADVVLRSADSVDFHVYSFHLMKASLVFKEMLNSPSARGDTAPHGTREGYSNSHVTVISLREDQVVLSDLLTLIFPVPVFIPETYEEIVSVLVAAHKYKLEAAISILRLILVEHARALIAPEDVFRAFCLARQSGLVHESLHALRSTTKTWRTIEALGDRLLFATGTSLDELWRHQQQVENNLESAIASFRALGIAQTPWKNCTDRSWLDSFFTTIHTERPFLNPARFHRALRIHITSSTCESCSGLSIQDMQSFWEQLEGVVEAGIRAAEGSFLSGLEHGTSQESSQASAIDLPNDFGPPFDRSDASVVLRSSDGCSFRVHKSTLAMASPFFADMFSLPPPPQNSPQDGDDFLGGLPVVCVEETKTILNILLTMVYPVPVAQPASYAEVLSVLSAAQKYMMETTMVVIRSMVDAGHLPRMPSGDQAYLSYALASRYRLVEETKAAARLTIGLPLSFGSLSDILHAFDGASLHALFQYHTLSCDAVLSCLLAAADCTSPSAIVFASPPAGFNGYWKGCWDVHSELSKDDKVVANWWVDFFKQTAERTRANRGCPPIQYQKLQQGFFAAREEHKRTQDCKSLQCSGEFSRVYGEMFCKGLFFSELKAATQKVELELPW